MPMAGEQLERSILERKERDELHAIASAMSLKPTARSKKSDIIDLILTATGVGEGETDRTNGAVAVLESSPADSQEAPPRPRRSPRTATPRRTNGTEGHEPASANGTDAAPMPAVASTEDALSPLEDQPAVTAETGADDSDGATSSSGEGTRGSEGAVAGDGIDQARADGGRSESAGGGRNGSSAPRENRANQGSNANGANQGGPSSGGHNQAGGQIDAGNRRSRRRRGRDRERGGDVQSGQDAPWQGELVPVKGLLDLRDEGYGFLRTSGYLPSPRDVYVSVSQARRFALRRGDAIEGACRPAGPSEKYPALVRIDAVSGQTPDEARNRPRFEDLTPLFPDEQLRLETLNDPLNVTARIVDLISPIGKGQRGMIVSPPKAGKTTVMKQIAHSIEANNPEVHLIVLLVDERPEEVTDMRRSVKGEVIASTFDRPADEHTAVAELTIERAKRLVEMGKDVVIILDGITRLARAYNLAQPATGRIMSGGVDSGALYPPKKFFGAARNIEEGGSLTILATALVETGSRMDEVIFEEFKGTGNLELRLDRRLAERRLYPAIDVNGSSTRHEELLFDRSQLQQVWKLRRVLNGLGDGGNPAAGLELLMDKLRTTRSNGEFLAEIAKAPTGN
jgi:transcription termination factor Rho